MRRPAALSRLFALPLATAALVAGGSGSAAAAQARTFPFPSFAGKPGAMSIGDSLFPTLGNGGYNALSYDVHLAYGATSTTPVTGNISMLARATQTLSSFSLDFAGQTVGSVSVNGAPATFTRTAEKLVVTPKQPLLRGLPFVVTMGGFVATPAPYDPDVPESTAFVSTPNGTFTAGQPAYEHYWFPGNDTPADKASFRFVLSAPSDQTAVANGVLTGKSTTGGRTTWTYMQRQPMATELMQLVVGAYDVVERPASGGVRLRDVITRGSTAELSPVLAIEAEQMKWMEARVGKYPFDLYGTLVTEPSVGFALETQTLSLFDTTWFSDTPRGYTLPTMTHELAHQWFGDSVAPADWADIWLNEGHATWYEVLWADEFGYLADDTGDETIIGHAQRLYEDGDRARAEQGPVAAPPSGSDEDVFNSQVYDGGFLVFYALREKIGTPAFERLERLWVARYRGRSVRTKDYIALASAVSGQDLTGFLNDWLYGTKTPPMPNHPDWTVTPYTGAAAANARSIAPAAPRAVRR